MFNFRIQDNTTLIYFQWIKFISYQYFLFQIYSLLEIATTMRRGFSDAQQHHDSFQQYNLNHAGLEEAEQNYFLKYATSGFSEVNNIQKVTKKVETKTIKPEPGAFTKIKNTQNEVLKQLKQQYEILRNLPIDDKIGLKSKVKQRPPTSQYSSSIDDRSDLTSSKQSRSKKMSRDAEILAIEKKQLEIVISNSLKKIEELLQNEMQLKKTIHELKLQIEGKGGINSEYQSQIRSLKKTEKELRENIEMLKSQIQKKNLSIKQLGQKNAFLEGQKSRRDQQHKSFYESQRQIEDLLRKEKDRSMNAELQVKRVQMEFQIFQKDKTAEINRLMRELDYKNQSPERNSQTIRNLQEQIKMKDHKIQGLGEQIQNLKAQMSQMSQMIRPVSPPPPPPAPQQDSNIKIFQELVRQMKTKSQFEAKQNNEAIVRALVDKIGSRKDESLKSEISNIRAQVENIKKGSAVSEVNIVQQSELKGRIRELERAIEEQKREKKSLLQEIERLKSEKEQLYSECESYKKRIREYKLVESRLLSEIESLGNFKIELQESKMQNAQIKTRLQTILSSQNVVSKVYHIPPQNEEVQSHSECEQQIRLLRRKVDELTFSLNKVTEQKTLSENMLREEQNIEVLRLNEDITRYRQLLKTNEEEVNALKENLKYVTQTKNVMIEDLTKRFQELNSKNQTSIENSRVNYESLLKAEVAKHYSQIQSMNQKILELTKTNESFLAQGQYFASIEKQVQELRRLTRNQKRTNEAIDHLWEVKEAEYSNISEILTSVRG